MLQPPIPLLSLPWSCPSPNATSPQVELLGWPSLSRVQLPAASIRKPAQPSYLDFFPFPSAPSSVSRDSFCLPLPEPSSSSFNPAIVIFANFLYLFLLRKQLRYPDPSAPGGLFCGPLETPRHKRQPEASLYHQQEATGRATLL